MTLTAKEITQLEAQVARIRELKAALGRIRESRDHHDAQHTIFEVDAVLEDERRAEKGRIESRGRRAVSSATLRPWRKPAGQSNWAEGPDGRLVLSTAAMRKSFVEEEENLDLAVAAVNACHALNVAPADLEPQVWALVLALRPLAAVGSAVDCPWCCGISRPQGHADDCPVVVARVALAYFEEVV